MKKIYLIATIVAIITGIAVFLFVTQLQNSNVQSTQTNMVTVVVAATDIAENTTITAEMLTTGMFSEDKIPQTAVKDANYLINKIAKYPVSKGEQFLTNKVLVIGNAENTELSERIQSGYRAFTVTVDEVNGIVGYLRIGDKIDIIISKTIDGESATYYCLQNVKIIAIGNSAQYANNVKTITSYSTITLEVDAKECLKLTSDLMNGLVKIVLRGYGDDKILNIPILTD